MGREFREQFASKEQFIEKFIEEKKFIKKKLMKSI